LKAPQFLFVVVFFLYCCVVCWYIVAFTKVLTLHQLYHTWIHTFYHFPLSLSAVHGTISTGIIFAFTCMCTHFLHHIHCPTPFLHHLPPPTGANPSPWAGPVLPTCSLILQKKIKRKPWHFLLVWGKDSYTGSFLVVFPCIYVLYPSWVISSNYLHSTLVPFLWWFQPV
jgi:hypothetical protein